MAEWLPRPPSGDLMGWTDGHTDSQRRPLASISQEEDMGAPKFSLWKVLPMS